MNDGERLDDWWNGLIPSSVTDAENKAMEAQQGEATAALQSAQLTTEKLQDALSTIKVLTRERDEMEAIAERTHGDLLRVQVELDAAIKRAEAAEATLALADRYGADQWRRGNAGKEPQEFAEWRKEAQP